MSDKKIVKDALGDCRGGYLYMKEYKSKESRVGIGVDRCIKSSEKALKALDNLIDKTELITKLEGMKADPVVQLKKLRWWQHNSDNLISISRNVKTHNASIDAVIQELTEGQNDES